MEIVYFSYKDFILVPLFMLLSIAILNFIKRKSPHNAVLQTYLVKGYVYKVFFAIFLCFFIYYQYGYGDTLSYYKEAMQVKQLIQSGREDLSIIFKDFSYVTAKHGDVISGANSGWIVERIVLLLSYLCLDSYLTITVCFATLAYSGMFKMFETFVKIMPAYNFRLALIVLFFPTVTMYGSGVLKDTISISALGWLVYAGYMMAYVKPVKIKYVAIFFASAMLIGFIKVYILAAFLIPSIFFIIMKLLKNIKYKLIRWSLMPVLILIIASLYFTFSSEIENALGYYGTEKLIDNIADQQKNYKALEAESGSNFDIGPMENTFNGFLQRVPAGIVATLYRPFIWESKNIMMLFTALESLMILFYTLYVLVKVNPVKFMIQLFTDPVVFLCIIFSLLFAAFVGVSTLNFGTLARYRIPILPFYVMGIMYIKYKSNLFTKNTGSYNGFAKTL